MNPRTLLRTTGLLALAVVAFVVSQALVRDLEVTVAVALLEPLFGDALLGAGHTVVITPNSGLPFLADVRPSCSSIGAVIAVAILGSMIARTNRTRATIAAVIVVTVGNLLRIAGSLGFGVAYGKSTLILFHDAAGGAFTFLYLILGFATYLWFTLPSASGEEPRRAEVFA